MGGEGSRHERGRDRWKERWCEGVMGRERRSEQCLEVTATTATLVSAFYIFGPQTCGYTQFVIPINIVIINHA